MNPETEEKIYFYTEDLQVGYGGKQILNPVRIGIKKGEILTLVGPNGAGKSTILKSVAAQLPPLGGAVYLDGSFLTFCRFTDFTTFPAFLPSFSDAGPEIGLKPRNTRILRGGTIYWRSSSCGSCPASRLSGGQIPLLSASSVLMHRVHCIPFGSFGRSNSCGSQCIL